MTALTIYGASDDLVEIRPKTDGLDEINVYDEPCVLKLTRDNGHAGCLIVMEYGWRGLWDASVGLLDEGVFVPWDIEIKHHAQVAYSVSVRVLDFDGRIEHIKETR